LPAKEPPGGDRRFQALDATLKRFQFQPDALIEVLHRAQALFGFLGTDVLWHVARALKLPPSRVYGVATFYHLFSLQPPGEHSCVVCRGTTCFVKGADRLLAAVEEYAQVGAGQTTPDRKLSLGTVRCIGTCTIAPVVVLDSQARGHQTTDSVLQQVKEWLPGGPH
jgi:bidirectional [NiFe] hydrogenase diaphorase subunit